MARVEAAHSASVHDPTALSTLGGLLQVYEAAIERGETLVITLEAGGKKTRMSNMNIKKPNKRESAVAAEVLAARGLAAGSRKVVAPGGGTARKEESARKRKSRERMEKHIREGIEKSKAREKERREQQRTGGAGGDGGGEAASAAAGVQAAPGSAGGPAHDAGQDQVVVQVQQLAGGAGGRGGGEAASAAVRYKMAPGQADAPARESGQEEGGKEVSGDEMEDSEDEIVNSEMDESETSPEAAADGPAAALADQLIVPAAAAGQAAKAADGEDLSTLTMPDLRKHCKERGLPSRGNKAVLLERLRGPKEVRPLPQLRDAARVKEKVISPTKDSSRAELCWNCEAEMGPGHQCHETYEEEKLKKALKEKQMRKEELAQEEQENAQKEEQQKKEEKAKEEQEKIENKRKKKVENKKCRRCCDCCCYWLLSDCECDDGCTRCVCPPSSCAGCSCSSDSEDEG
jgi:hypothetical protein